MRYKLVLLWTISYSLAITGAAAQPCDPAALGSIPGKFNPGMAGSIHNVSAADLAKERQVLANLHKKISSAYQPVGCEVTVANAFGYNQHNGKGWLADPYSYNLYFLKYVCRTSKQNNRSFNPDIASNTQVLIHINHLWSQEGGMTLYPAGLPDDHHSGYFRLRSWPQKKEGYYFWPLDHTHSPGNRTEYAYFITYDNQLPFRHLTRREYIPLKVKKIRKEIANTKMLLGQYGAESDTRLKETIREQEYLLAQVEGLLTTMTVAELDLPAIIDGGESDGEFRGFKKEGDSRAAYLAVPNTAYYNPKLPKWVPQFISIVIGRDTNNEVYSSNIRRFEAAIDFSYLRSLLGKTGAPLPIASAPQQRKN